MKQKKISACLLAGLLLVSAASCKKKDTESSGTAETTTAATTTAETEPATEAATQGATAAAQQISPVADTQHVFDPSGALAEADAQAINDAAAALAKAHNLHIAVQIETDLGGASPDEFAKTEYDAKYGENTGGMLLLINNGSGEDCVYASGACALYFTDSVRTKLLADMSPLLVTGKTKEAVDLVFAQISALCPTHFFDEVSCIPPLDANDLNGQAKLVTDAHPDTQLAVLLSTGASQALADCRCQELYDDSAAAFLVIQPDTGELFASINGPLSDQLGGTAVGALLDKVSVAYANSGVYGAAKRFYLEIGTILNS